MPRITMNHSISVDELLWGFFCDFSYTNIDVETYCKDMNGLQLLFNNIVEIWQKVGEPEKKK